MEVFGVHPDQLGVSDQVADRFHEVRQRLPLPCSGGVNGVEVAFERGDQAFVFLDLDLLALEFVVLFEVVVQCSAVHVHVGVLLEVQGVDEYFDSFILSELVRFVQLRAFGLPLPYFVVWFVDWCCFHFVDFVEQFAYFFA